MPIQTWIRILPGCCRLLVVLSSLSLLAAPACADVAATEFSEQYVKLRGFGTLGLARASKEDVQFVRDLSQPQGVANHWTGKTDSLLGIQANIGLSRQTEIVLQGISRGLSLG